MAVNLLALIKSLTLLSDDHGSCLLERIRPGLPTVSGRVEACFVAATLLSRVNTNYAITRLRRIGFSAHEIQGAMAKQHSLPKLHLKRVSFAAVKDLPMTAIMGFPESFSARHARLIVCSLDGYMGFAAKQPLGMLVAFVWWRGEETAAAAVRKLQVLRLEEGCPSVLEILPTETWTGSCGGRPPPIVL